VAAKRRLVAELTADDWLVLPADDHDTCRLVGSNPARAAWFGEAPSPEGDGAFATPGGVLLRWDDREHVHAVPLGGTALRAGLAACAAAMALGVAPGDAALALSGLPAVAHRMAALPGPRGITIIDDSMAATPLKTRAAAEQAPQGDLVVVIGGNDAPDGLAVHASPEEQAALRDALRAVRGRATAVVAFGPASARITPVIDVDVLADDIDAALDAAIGACTDGGTVLVSPMFPLRPDERERVASRP
jgi:UDP-N-acetylmuramoylalanine--D-glutamate ligase